MKVAITRAGVTISLRVRTSPAVIGQRAGEPPLSIPDERVACVQAAMLHALHEAPPQLVEVLERFEETYQLAYLDLLRREVGIVAEPNGGRPA